MRKCFVFLFLFIPALLFAQDVIKPIPQLSEQKKQELVKFLKENWKSPEAIDCCPSYRFRKRIKSPDYLMNVIQRDANMKNRFKDFK